MKINYPGEWYIVCGNNDETIPEYQRIWGKDKILIFDWYKEVKTSDLMDNFGFENKPSGAVPVRNAVRRISWDRGELRHWQFDDDYVDFRHIDTNLKKFVRMDGKFFEKELYKIALFGYNTGLTNVGFGLAHECYPDSVKEVSKRVFNAHNMPSDPERFNTWRGRMNDDLINAIDVYHQGKVEFSFKFMYMILAPTQQEAGGNTELYKEDGTVRKTAYAILANPGVVKLVVKYGRYHHSVNWQKISPKIIREKYAKI